jgi:2-dehydropantoate 2-reductase
VTDVRVDLVGLGAVGAGYGSQLLAAGLNVQVVVDPRRAERYRGQPTIVNGVAYDFPIAIGAAEPAELAIVAVKSPALGEAIELLRPRVGAGTVILSLLNGVDSEAVLAEAFPQATVLLALTVGIDAVRHGREVSYTSLGRVMFGEPTNIGEPSPAVRRVAEVLQAAGIAYVIPDDMRHQLWWKFLINVGINQVSAVLGAPYAAFQSADSPAREAMIAAQREVIAVANAKGVALSEADLDAWLEVLATLGPDNYTSMAQDALAGRPTEVDIFGGRVSQWGRDHGVPTPVNDLLVQLLRAGTTLPPRRFG